jgi:hypothetical protein
MGVLPDHRRRSGNYAVVLPWLHVPPSLILVATQQEVRVGLPSRFRGPSTGSRRLDGISFVLVLRADPTLSYGHQGWLGDNENTLVPVRSPCAVADNFNALGLSFL